MRLTVLKMMLKESMVKYEESCSEYDRGICGGISWIIELMENERAYRKKTFDAIIEEKMNNTLS